MLFEKHIYILTLEMASARNQHSEAFEKTRATTQETQKVVYFWILKKRRET